MMHLEADFLDMETNLALQNSKFVLYLVLKITVQTAYHDFQVGSIDSNPSIPSVEKV